MAFFYIAEGLYHLTSDKASASVKIRQKPSNRRPRYGHPQRLEDANPLLGSGSMVRGGRLEPQVRPDFINSMSRDVKPANLKHLLKALEQDGSVQTTGLTLPALAYAVTRIHHSIRKPVVVVLPENESTAAFGADLRFFLAHEASLLSFPAYNLLPYKRLDRKSVV